MRSRTTAPTASLFNLNLATTSFAISLLFGAGSRIGTHDVVCAQIMATPNQKMISINLGSAPAIAEQTLNLSPSLFLLESICQAVGGPQTEIFNPATQGPLSSLTRTEGLDQFVPESPIA